MFSSHFDESSIFAEHALTELQAAQEAAHEVVEVLPEAALVVEPAVDEVVLAEAQRVVL